MSVRKAVLGSERVLVDGNGYVYRPSERAWVPAIGAVPVSEPIERWVDVGQTWLGHSAWFSAGRRYAR